MIFNIIFVRHGLSCANVLSAKRPGFQLFYQDPELTFEGIYNSKDFSQDLIDFIHEKWGDEDYLVASSQMIRAQETAYHMLASKVDKPIMIFPHVGEKPLTYDNYSLPRAEQREIMGKRAIDEGILYKLEEQDDFREEQTMTEKSNFPKFIDWALDHFSQPVNMVIFTHGMFIRSIVKNLPHVSNNNAVHVMYNTDTDDFENKPSIHSINKRKILYECPDDCRKTRCAEKTRKWGSAGRRERISILEAEKNTRKLDELYNLQKPKTLKNYVKRGYYGFKRLFNGKRFTNRVKNAEARRNMMVSKIPSARKFNKATRAEQEEILKEEVQNKPKRTYAKYFKSWFHKPKITREEG